MVCHSASFSFYHRLTLAGAGALIACIWGGCAQTPADHLSPTPTHTPSPVAARPLSGPELLYTFEEEQGITIHDRAEDSSHPLDLTIQDSTAVNWADGALDIQHPTILRSAGPATSIIDASRATNEITIEAWLKPASLTQAGPARILTISRDTSQRNITLGQGLWDEAPTTLFDIRLRTTATKNNGLSSLSTLPGSATNDLTHIVYTRDASGIARTYVNGIEETSAVIGGTFANWENDYSSPG